jgi:hypothetical protein
MPGFGDEVQTLRRTCPIEQVTEVGHLFKSTTKDAERPQGGLHELAKFEFCTFQNFVSAARPLSETCNTDGDVHRLHPQG